MEPANGSLRRCADVDRGLNLAAQLEELKAAPWLRGPQRAADMDLTRYFLLCHKHAHGYDLVFGSHDDAFQIAVVGLLKARDRWEPTRGPFETIAAYYVLNSLNVEVEQQQKRDGVPTHERLLGRKSARHREAAGMKPVPQLRGPLTTLP